MGKFEKERLLAWDLIDTFSMWVTEPEGQSCEDVRDTIDNIIKEDYTFLKRVTVATFVFEQTRKKSKEENVKEHVWQQRLSDLTTENPVTKFERLRNEMVKRMKKLHMALW